MTEKDNMHIKVRVYPDSKTESFVARSSDSFEVYLREPAKQGMANRRLLVLLSEKLSPKPKQLKIVSGHLSPSKTIEARY